MNEIDCLDFGWILSRFGQILSRFGQIHDAVDDFLRVYPFVVVINLVTIGGNTARHNMNMVVVSIMVGVDENRLAVLTIAHFFEVLVGNVQKLPIGVFVTSAGDGQMELGLLDTLVILIGVVEKLLLQLIWGVLLVDEVETFYFQEFGNSLADLPLVIINGVEGGARR